MTFALLFCRGSFGNTLWQDTLVSYCIRSPPKAAMKD